MEGLEMEPRKVRIALGIVTNKDGEVLIIQRKKQEKGAGHAVLHWAFPGGKVEDGETISEATKREVLEETGYTVEVEREISSREHPQFPVYVYYSACKVTSRQPLEKSDREVNQIKWVKPKDLQDIFTTDFDEKVKKFLNV